MTHQLTVDYDERDFLQIWVPELNTEPFPEFEPGLYEMATSSARRKGMHHAFDSIMIDDFSKTYPDIIDEVKRKEPPVEQENYDVPELDLYQAQLSTILEEIYRRFVEKKEMSRQKAEVLV
jgi:hypothetical protein